jgi:hypothetical protein
MGLTIGVSSAPYIGRLFEIEITLEMPESLHQ